jgi:Mg2+ and Co2+ transporter CorA
LPPLAGPRACEEFDPAARRNGTTVHLADLDNFDRDNRRIERREAVDNIFSEGLMVALSLLLIPVLVIPLLFDLPEQIDGSLVLLSYVILAAFILEYALKLLFAADRRRFAADPWHLLDLFIILASLATVLVGEQSGAGGLPIVLRLLRVPVAVTLTGRSLGRERLRKEEVKEAPQANRPLMESVLVMNNPGEGWKQVPFPQGRLVPGSRVWRDLSNVSVSDLSALGSEVGLSGMALEEKIKGHAYPRAETVNGSAMVFLRIPAVQDGQLKSKGWSGRWNGLLVLEHGNGLITVSSTAVPTLRELPRRAGEEGLELTPITVLYLLLRESLASIEEGIVDAEMELVQLESIPMSKQPRSFLNLTYEAKKETGQTISWLIHTKAVCQNILDSKVRLQDWSKEDELRMRTLLEKCEFLLETAENVEGGLGDAVDFYLNTSSFQMNGVMRIIAVMTALTIFPTIVGGLMGMNLIDTPWDVSLAEVVTALGVVMAATAWVYYKLGWLRS